MTSNMVMPIEGGCLCGRVRYRIERAGGDDGGDRGNDQGGDPVGRLTYCHCSMCRKATGGGFAMLVPVPHERLRWTGSPPDTIRASAIATRGFCGRCGSPLFYAGDGNGAIELTAGSFDDPSFLVPHHHDGIEVRQPWADCGVGLPGRRTGEPLEPG